MRIPFWGTKNIVQWGTPRGRFLNLGARSMDRLHLASDTHKIGQNPGCFPRCFGGGVGRRSSFHRIL